MLTTLTTTSKGEAPKQVMSLGNDSPCAMWREATGRRVSYQGMVTWEVPPSAVDVFLHDVR
jgi:hypothetical protein